LRNIRGTQQEETTMDRITSIKPSLVTTAVAFAAIAAASPALALNAGLGLGTSAGVNASTNGTLSAGPVNTRADAAADMGATSNDSVNSNNSGALIRGNSGMSGSGSAGTNSAVSVHSVMPMGRHSYTYYPGANTYMSSDGMYYYRVGNQWRSSRTKPDVTLTGGQKVYINGTAQ